MAVLDLDQPTTARGFLTAFANRYPQHRQRLWQTAMNSRWDLDQLPPNAPSGVGPRPATPSARAPPTST
jgi:hypothetical protein